MRKILSLLTIFSSLVPGVIVTKNTIGCGVNNNMVKIYGLGIRSGSDKWVPIEIEQEFMIELDKTKVEKYTLDWTETPSVGGGCYIKFYFKDGTVNNTNNRIWSGPSEEYAKYIKSLIGLDPTEEN